MVWIVAILLLLALSAPVWPSAVLHLVALIAAVAAAARLIERAGAARGV